VLKHLPVQTGNAMGRLDGLQGLRFVAAMLVVVMHSTESVHGRGGDVAGWSIGSFGVDIFFVISGFVMALTAPLAAGAWRSRVAAAVEFMRRRILRVVPLYWAYTLLKLILVLAIPAAALRTRPELGHIVTSFLFLPGMDPTGVIMPFMPVGWTLNYEMFFYAVFAIAIALAAPRIIFCMAAFAALIALANLFPGTTALRFYGNAFVFEFVWGMLLAYLWWRGLRLPAWAAVGAVAVGAYLVLVHGLPAGSVRFLTWGACAALIVYGVVSLESSLHAFRFLPQLRFLGDSSYSLYLSHTFVVPITVAVLVRYLSGPAAVVAMMVLATFVGSLSYVFLEKPVTNFLKHRFSGKKQAPATVV